MRAAVLITHLVEHVRRQADHGEVVNYEEDLQVDRLPVSHEPGAEPHHTEVEEEDEGDGDGGVHQQPRVCPFIWEMTDSTLTCWHAAAAMQVSTKAGFQKSASLCTSTHLDTVGGWSLFLLYRSSAVHDHVTCHNAFTVNSDGRKTHARARAHARAQLKCKLRC